MQSTGLGQRGLATRAACMQVVRPLSSQNASQLSGSFVPPPMLRTSYSRRARIVCSATEDYSPANQKLDLPLSTQSQQSSRADESSSAVSDNSEKERIGTISDVLQGAVKAVSDAPALTVAQMLLLGGVATLTLVVSGSIMKSLAFLPLAPEALQTVGVAYSALLASQLLQKKSLSFPPPSPFKAVIQLVDNGQPSGADSGQKLSQDDRVMQMLVRERDTAVRQMEEMRAAAANYARVVSEKEALEAVSLQLADERDGAISEVSALRDAVVAMTNRMKAIEEMLEQEVSMLKKQNEALETVALQLAAERDSALQEVEDIRSSTAPNAQLQDEMQCLEEVAIQLAQERDTALAEIEDLKKVVASIREAASTASGLTSEQEVFIKARVRALRSQYIDVERGYEEQKEEVDRLIGHLVREYGAPEEWTNDYIIQFLDMAATKSTPGVGLTQVESQKAQTSA